MNRNALSYATKGYYIHEGQQRKDTFTQIYESALRSKAFQDLTPNARLLYIYMRSQEMGKRKPNRDFDESSPAWEIVRSELCFYFPWRTAKRYSKRYERNSGRLYKDRDELIEHGFIENIVSGHNTRTNSIYKFSEKWKQWGEGEKKT